MPTPPPAAAPVVVVSGEPIGIQAALRALRASGAAERLLAQAPRSAHVRVEQASTRRNHGAFVKIALGVVVLAVFINCVSRIRDSGTLVRFAPDGTVLGASDDGTHLASFLPLLIVAVVIYFVFRTLYASTRRPQATPSLRPALAGVSDKRTDLSSSGRDTTTNYFVTLELEDGVRREFEVESDLYASLRSGDVGAAWWCEDADGELVDFERAAAG